jgi:nitrate reductase NapAB chaperone NapD
MEKALILGKLSHRVPRNIIDQFKKIKGVSDADMIFGPHDFYIIINTESKEMLGDTSLKIRSLEGVLDTQTCYVVALPDIRPEATGSYAE